VATSGTTLSNNATAGTKNIAHVTFRVGLTPDTTDPTSTVTFPTNGSSYTTAAYNAGCTPIGFCGTATDNQSGVNHVEISIQKGTGNYWNAGGWNSAAEVYQTIAITAAAGTVSWSYAFPAANLTDGQYTVHLRAVDNANRTQAFMTRVFQYDNLAPTTTPTFPVTNGSYTGAAWDAGCATIGFCGTASDAVSNVTNVQLSIRQGAANYYDGASFASASEVYLNVTAFTAGSPITWSYPFLKTKFPADGVYTVHVKATDAAGNIEAFQILTIRYDNAAPATVLTFPADNSSGLYNGAAWVAF